MNRTLIAVLAFAAWSAAMFGAGWAWRGDRADTAEAKGVAQQAAATVEQVTETRATEHKQAESLATIGAKHEQDREAAATVPAAVVADLRAGALRLRDGWAGCETQRLSDASAAATERDAATKRREEFAGSVVRVGRDADDQLRACQAVIQAYRSGVAP